MYSNWFLSPQSVIKRKSVKSRDLLRTSTTKKKKNVKKYLLKKEDSNNFKKSVDNKRPVNFIAEETRQ